MLFIILGISLFVPYISGERKMHDVNIQDPNEINNLTFALSLPNEDTVQIGFSFRLLTYTHLEAPDNAKVAAAINNENSSSSTFNESRSSAEVISKKKFFTVGEAIEGFGQDLNRKESETAGII